MLVANIPRRKIYEKLLEYEEHVLEIQILARDKESFKKFHDKYPDTLKKAKQRYKEIKVLLVMFFEKLKPETEEEYTDLLSYYLINESEVDEILKKKRRLGSDFKKLLKSIDKIMKKYKNIDSYYDAKLIFEKLDEFNSQIPIILETKKEEIQ